MNIYNLGIDIGSTTLKWVLLDNNNNIIDKNYVRHCANHGVVLLEELQALMQKIVPSMLRIGMTGSVGMGYAERMGMYFVQEVIAEAKVVQTQYPTVQTLIDMGGEDSKMIFFSQQKSPDIRMNGNCAGGTGAFIDQTAQLLGVPVEDFDSLATGYDTIYPIASRCGVFSKTDIQNLISQKVSKQNLVASVFRAVALQVVTTLSRGCDVKPSVLFCGGPFAYFKQLKKHFLEVLNLTESHCITPEYPQYFPAMGCAMMAKNSEPKPLSKWIVNLQYSIAHCSVQSNSLPILFTDTQHYNSWLKQKKVDIVKRASIVVAENIPYFLGVDSGSTTTKMVLINENAEVVFTHYLPNHGDSMGAFATCLKLLNKSVMNAGELRIAASCATGYGESLLKAAYNMSYGIVETMAHFMAAHYVQPNVSFVLDIGGQDMKAIFVRNGSIERMEINEACSSGCGSFIQTYAQTMNMEISKFAQMACFAKRPCDLGTRCTVFMNSKVKQVMREGCSVADIAAGFSYSVVKNCLYKVLKLKDARELGSHIVVQGGTFKNHSVARALEVITGTTAQFTDIPELMGAYGAALYALQQYKSQHHE